MKPPFISLFYKSLGAILAILLPILIIFLIGYTRNRQYIEEEALTTLHLIAEGYEGMTYQFLEMSQRRAEDFASDGFIREELQKITEHHTADVARLNDHLVRNKKSLDESIHTIQLYSLDGRVVSATDPSTLNEDVSTHDSFLKGKKGGGATLVKSPDDGRPELIISTPVSNRVTGVVIGVLTNRIYLSELNKVLSGQFFKHLGAPSSGKGRRRLLEAYIVDGEKKLIADSSLMKDKQWGQTVDTEPVRACLESGKETIAFYSNHRGAQMAGASMCFPTLGWTLLVEIDKEEVLSPVKMMQKDGFIAVVFVGGLIGILFLLFSRTVIIPIKKISSASRDIALGNYDVTVDVHSNDELGALAETFDGMAFEIKRTTNAYRESEEKLAEAQRIAHVGNWEWDISRDRLNWYYEVYKIFGIAPHEFGSTFDAFLAFIHPDDREAVENAFAEAREGTRPLSLDHRITRPDGTVRIVHQEGILSKRNSPSDVKMIGTVQDVTERRAAAEALQKSEGRLKEAQKIAHLGNWDWDIETNELFWSDEVYRVFGFNPGEIDLNYESFLCCVHPDDRGYVMDSIEMAIEGEASYSIDHRALQVDGTIRIVHEQGEVFRDDEGKAVRMVGTVQDVTEQKKVEEGIRRSHKAQKVVNAILALSLEPLTLDEQLNQTLDLILSIPWLSSESKGSIYLIENDPDLLILKMHRGFKEEQLALCSTVPVGKCICGRAAESRKLIFTSTIDDRHDFTFPGMKPHGHYCVPILSGERLLGVLNVSLSDGHKEDDVEKEFLSTVASTLASIFERKEAEFELKILSATIEQSVNIVFITDVDGTIEYVNSTFEEVTGYLKEEIIGEKPNILASGETDRAVYEEMWDRILTGNNWQGKLKNRKKNGQYFWVSSMISPILNEEGKTTHFLAIQENITEKMRSEEMAEYFATHDELTGLINRQTFMAQLDEWIGMSKSKKRSAALIMIDIDEFKYINDNFGHLMGDEYLRRVASMLKNMIAGLDDMRQDEEAGTSVVCRIGADEFLIFLSSRKEAEAMKAAVVLGEAIADFRLGEMQINSTASMGVVLYPDHGTTTKVLLPKSDAALYRAKELGYNKCHLYTTDDRYLEEVHSRVDWKRRVEEALKDDRFELWYQPIMGLKDDSISHYEVLVRMRDTDGKLLMPGTFIGFAEEVGLIGSIDRLVANKAIDVQVAMAAKGRDVSLGINLSGKDLGSEEILEYLKKTINEKGVDPSKLIFEITETAAIHDLQLALKFIDELKAMGCKFSLDDFGVGFTSFVYLREMNVDYIKIDGSFIRNLHKSHNDQVVVKSIIDVARGMGVKTVAEFVEKEETLELLRKYKVDYAQGYLIGKPSPKPLT